MRELISSKIIQQYVLNECGEITPQNMILDKVKVKTIRSGFRMMYKDYDEVVINIINSSKELSNVVYIRDLFTYKKEEIILSAITLSKVRGIHRKTATQLLKAMCDNKLLFKIATNQYRLNPFMYLPYKADGLRLQTEWLELNKE